MAGQIKFDEEINATVVQFSANSGHNLFAEMLFLEPAIRYIVALNIEESFTAFQEVSLHDWRFRQ